MPPYEPPSAHYAHVNISEYDTDAVFRFVGKNGWRFKKLTTELNVKYIYYHHEHKRISVHGPWSAMQKLPCAEIVKQLDEYVEHEKMCTGMLTDNDAI